MTHRSRFDAPRFYHNIRYHLIEIVSIISLVICLYKVTMHEW
jgi:hypothetical protein